MYDTAHREDGRLMDGGIRISHPGIQIRVRANDYTVGYTKLRDIAIALDGVSQAAVVVNANNYVLQSVSRVGPIPLGTDANNREGFTLNAVCTIT